MQKSNGLLVVVFLLLSRCAFSQNTDSTTALQPDSTKSVSYFSGAISVTNNGISIVPSFSLGKPAAISTWRWGRTGSALSPISGSHWLAGPGHFFYGGGTKQ